MKQVMLTRRELCNLSLVGLIVAMSPYKKVIRIDKVDGLILKTVDGGNKWVKQPAANSVYNQLPGYGDIYAGWIFCCLTSLNQSDINSSTERLIERSWT